VIGSLSWPIFSIPYHTIPSYTHTHTIPRLYLTTCPWLADAHTRLVQRWGSCKVLCKCWHDLSRLLVSLFWHLPQVCLLGMRLKFKLKSRWLRCRIGFLYGIGWCDSFRGPTTPIAIAVRSASSGYCPAFCSSVKFDTCGRQVGVLEKGTWEVFPVKEGRNLFAWNKDSDRFACKQLGLC